MSVEYIIALGAAFLYAVSILFIKKALDKRAGLMRITFILNWFMVFAFLPLLFYKSRVYDWSLWLYPVLTGLCLLLAQIAVFGALKTGDASIQTPVMGTKAFMVAIFASCLGIGYIPFSWWIGSALSLLAIYFLSYAHNCPILKRKNILTIALAFVGACFFGLGDVLMEYKAGQFGEIPFLVIAMIVAALGSFCLVPFFEGKLFKIPKNAHKWVLLGSFLYAIEAIGFYIAISFYGKATAVNILYSSRGMWSIILVWSIGRFFVEKDLIVSSQVMFRRALGALLIFIAILLVVLS